MTEQEYLYAILHIQGIGAVAVSRLYEYFGGFREVWKAGEKELISGGLTSKRAAIFAEERARLSKRMPDLGALAKKGTRFVTFFDRDYPKRLAPYTDKPAALFVKGGLPENEVPCAAIVGARDCTEYGRKTAGILAAELAKEGVRIVSGLALGIDGAAHKGALDAGGPTYAVLGCGADICYPRENHRLFSAMAERGGIISEFLPGEPPIPRNFPMRNRIISGLSDAVIVVEAREKSGSLITATHALEQGKEVFAVPGRATDSLSGGCNRLIKDGAAVCLGPDDVLDFFGIKFKKKLTVRKNSEKRLANNEKVLYSFLDSRPKHLEEIINGCGLGLTECMEILLKLELQGLVYGTGNQYYCRKL